MPSEVASKWKPRRTWGLKSVAWRVKYNVPAIVEDLKKRGVKVYRMLGADVVYGDEGTRFENKPLSELLIKAAKEGWDMYPGSKKDTHGDLVKAIAGFEKRQWGESYDPTDIILLPGSKFAYNLLYLTLLDTGDRISAIEPSHFKCTPACFVSSFYGAEVISCPSDESKDWEPDLEALRKSINEKTKFIVMDHPNNPCAALYSDKTLKEIANIAGEHDLLVLSDEIYRDFIFDGLKFNSMAKMAKDVPTITTYSLSKGCMKPGWALGYMKFHDPEGKIADVKDVASRIASTYGVTTGAIPTPMLIAAEAAFNEEVKYITDPCRGMMKQLQVRRDFTYRRLNEIEGVTVTKPKATMYAFPHIHAIGETWKTDEEFMAQLLKEKGICFIIGSAYGDSGFGHFRTLLLPTTEVQEEMYTRLERFLAEHTK